MSSKKQTWATAHSQLWTSPVSRGLGSTTQSEVSSIATPNRDRSLLDDVGHIDSFASAQAPHPQGCPPRERTLVQVSDILESYGTIATDADIPAVLLDVVKSLERAKQENKFKELLLREYSEAVQRRFGLYGEDSPPSVADIAKRLRNESAVQLPAAPTSVWLEEPLYELRHVLQEEAEACFHETRALPSPALLPDAAHTRANVTTLLRTCKDDLARLARECKDYRSTTTPSKPSLACVHEDRVGSGEQEAPQEAGALSETATAKPTPDTLRTALQATIDVVPASLQIHFDLQVPDAPVRERCDRLSELLRFLLSEYLSMERYMEGVDEQRQKLASVFRLPSSTAEHGVASDEAQIDDALGRSLHTLKKTVTGVVTFPHQISEEEIALRRTTSQAVEELAQLLVESRHASGSGAVGSAASGLFPGSTGTSGTRIEPPTHNLLEMVDMVKSRFAAVVTQQQRKELAGVQNRVGLAHMEETMKTQGKQVLQLLRDMCAAQDDGAGAGQTDALAELMSGLDVDRGLSPAKLDYFLSDVLERLRLVKTKYQRALNSAASSKTRAEAAAQKSMAAQKKLQKVAAAVEHVARDGLGLTFPSSLLGGGGSADADEAEKRRDADPAVIGRSQGDGVSALRRLNLRPALDAPAHKAALPAASAATPAEKATPAPTAAAATTAATASAPSLVNEHNVLEAVQFLAAHVSGNEELRDRVKTQEEVEQLRNSQARWKADTSAFHDAMAMLMQRLARNGQLVKQSLFLMGTDESPKDELVEEVLRRGETAATAHDEAEVEYVERSLAELLQKYTRWAQRLQQTTEDHLYTQRKIVKYFAAVRRFFTSQQQSVDAPPPPPEDIPEDNLYDIDACLMRAADIILPALDAAIRAADTHTRSSTASGKEASGLLSPQPSSSSSAAAAASREEAIANLVKDSAAAATGGVLPYDHRVARLYETVARLYTAVTSLLQVHYLCIPTAVKRRSSGDVDLVFDGDSDEDGFVDIDLDRLIRVSQTRSSGGSTGSGEGERFSREGAKDGSGSRAASSPPPSTVAANNDVILRVTYQNLEVLQDTLKRFSANHKMAAIVLQKDVDTMQQLLAGMLEKYSEVDMEKAFGQSREELHELYVTLRDRAQVQKGCYFFNRIGGEGSCTWVAALEQLGEGFHGVVDRLVQRTAQAAECRELTDEVKDVCAMYVNWADRHTLPASHTLPAELVALCVRDGSEACEKPVAPTEGAKEREQQRQRPPVPPTEQSASCGSAGAVAPKSVPPRPPKPSTTPPLTPRDSNKEQQQRHEEGGQTATTSEQQEAAAPSDHKVCGFTENRAILKVMQHMFQLAQVAADEAAQPQHNDAGATATSAAATLETEAKAQQLAEELSVLREAIAVAERHVDELTEEKHAVEQQRDQAQSEAAVARAELRRWKRLQQQQQQHEQMETAPPRAIESAAASPQQQQQQQGPPPPPASSSTRMDEATVQEVMEYMRALSEELQAAKQRAGAGRPARGGEEAEAELVRSPCPPAALAPSESDTADGESRDSAAESEPHMRLVRPPNASSPSSRYAAALAEGVRHQYGSSPIAPMMVVDPGMHYGSPHHHRHYRGYAASPQPHQQQQGGTPQRRYTPVKFRGPAYDACDRFYTRELGDVEGEHEVDRRRRQGTGVYSATSPSTASLTGVRTPQRRPMRRAARTEAEVHYDPHFDSRVVRKAAAAGAAASASSTDALRYPRALSRDAPLGAPVASTTPSRVYRSPQRATPVLKGSRPVSPHSASGARHRSVVPVLPVGRADPRRGSHSDRAEMPSEEEESQEEEEVFYDDDARWGQDGGWYVPPHTMEGNARRSSSAKRQYAGAGLPFSAARHTASSGPSSSSGVPSSRERLGAHHQQHSASAARSRDSGGRVKRDDDLSGDLAEAMRKIEAATQRGTPTPTRRRGDAQRPSTAAPATPEQQMSRNANLRAAALRRLAEVVSKTKVTPTRGERF